MSVLLVHGAGSTVDHNFRRAGWVDLLEAAGHTVVGYHLPGHGPAAGRHFADGAQIVDDVLASVPEDGPVDAIGFSAGAQLLAATAAREPARFRRLVLLGVGDGVLRPNVAGIRALVAALSGGDDRSGVARVFRRAAHSAGNDIDDVRRYLDTPKPPVTADELAKVESSVLVVLGDRDFNAPADDLVAAFGQAELRTVPGADHFGLTADVRCLEIALAFLES